MHPILILLLGMAVVIGGIVRFKLNAFLALLLAAILVSLLAPGEAAEKITRVAAAFGSTAGTIGVVIALAAITGSAMKESGAADRIVVAFLSLLGEKRAAEGAYVWRKLMDAGSTIPIGTDVPVERIDPMANFHAAVTRKLKDGTTFTPGQKMTREEALRAYTINGAYAAFETGLKGSLAPGKLADITVLSRDIMTCPEDDIPGTEVLYTIIGGKVVYHR